MLRINNVGVIIGILGLGSTSEQEWRKGSNGVLLLACTYSIM